jgi:TPP-dependent pyruvate/acetoin dehydrogenase alpha subunit
VYDAAYKAVQRSRKGEGPTLIEGKTYRHKGHSRVDPAKYRAKEEVEEWLAKDPVKRLREKLLRDCLFSEEDVERMRKKALADVEEAVKFAIESPHPAGEEALEDVYG